MKCISALLAIALAGCSGSYFRWEDAAKVKNGMSEAEVTAILGTPYSRTPSGEIMILTWSFATVFTGAKAVSYRMVNDRVTSTTEINK